MTKKSKDQGDHDEGVELLLTGRQDYLDRFMWDLEHGRIQLSDHEDVNTDRRLEYSEDGHVLIPPKVWDTLEAIRQSGVTNVADIRAVTGIAELMDRTETVAWLIANPVARMTAVIHGAQRKDEDDE